MWRGFPRKGSSNLTALIVLASLILALMTLYFVWNIQKQTQRKSDIANTALVKVRLAEEIDAMCRDEKAIGFIDNVRTLKYSLILAYSCEAIPGITTLNFAPDSTGWERFTSGVGKDVDVSQIDGWDDLVSSCDSEADKAKAVRIIQASYTQFGSVFNQISAEAASPWQATFDKLRCPNHDFVSEPPEGEILGNTLQSVEIGIDTDDGVYVLVAKPRSVEV